MLKRNFINISYKHKLRETYTLLMFVVLVLLCAFIYSQVDKIVEPLLSDIELQVVDTEAHNIEERFDNQKKLLEQFASREALKNGDFSIIKKEIDNKINEQGGLWLSMKYKLLSGEEYDNNADNIKSQVSYEEKLLAGDELTLISKPFIYEKYGEYITTIGTKVMDDNGKLKGLLVINIRVKHIIEAFEKTKIGKISEINELWILDSKGKVIENPNKEKKTIYDIKNFEKLISINSSGKVKFTTQNNKAYYLTYSQIPNTEGLYIAIGIEHNDFSKAMRIFILLILGAAILACLFVFVAAKKMTDFITKPLTRIVEIIRHTAESNLIEIPIDLKSSSDEIGILANTIDEMVRNNRKNVQALKNEIEERQKAEEELVALNDELESRIEERNLALKYITDSVAISEARFRIAMEAAHIGIYDSDSVSNKVVINSIFLKLINASEYNRISFKVNDWVQFNEQIEDYVYEEDLLNISQFSKDNLPEIGEDFYTEFRLKEDPEIWFSFIGQVIKNTESNKTVRFIGVLQNISERKRIKFELKAAKEEAEEASRTKSQFLANMSHEIRTPMNAIMGLTYLVSQTDLNDSQKTYISKIEGASTALLKIINDILDLSKIEAGKLELENIKFSLDKVLENVSNLFTISATKKGIDINFDTLEAVPEKMIGDPLRLEQIISNLLNNAIKFTNKGEVDFTVKVVGETENKVKLLFSVTDTGIGLTKEQIDKLFTAFTQADGSMTRKYGGTGLGLTISKQLVELMGGEIWVESVYGEGATFQFLVQFDKAVDIKKYNYAEYPDLQGKKVLVVDHNKTSRRILERMLLSFSFDVKALSNPFEAIELLRKEDYELLVVDFNIPELSGIDLYKRLVADTEIKVPKTIFVSATGHESYYTQVSQLGVKNFLVKPINQSLMFDAVMNTLKGTAWSQVSTISNKVNKSKYQMVLAEKRVLLVEDNEINQLVAKEILEQVGILVNIANNGEEAIVQVQVNKFDAVLMDVQMPIMDGYKATEILRKTYSSSELPIIAMTANALKGDREISIRSGMNDYISKPINPEFLYETLEKWFSGNRITDTDDSVKKTSQEKVEILDFEQTLIRLGNKKDFYYDLLKRYCDTYNNLAQEYSDMRLNKQNDEANRFIHSLKSVTGNIGAMKLNRFIINFEEQQESYNENTLREQIEELFNMNEELLNAIKKVISIRHQEENLLNSNFDIYEALVKLLDALEKAHAKEIKDRMNYLVANTLETEFCSRIKEAKKMVDHYRFKKAEVIIDELIAIVKE